MTNQSFNEQIHELVAADDLRGALELLRSLVIAREDSSQSGALASLQREVTLHLASLARLERERRTALVSSDDAERRLARLRVAALEMGDDVARLLQRSQLPVGQGPVVFAGPPTTLPLEKIIGQNTLKSIAWLKRGLEVASSVCRVVTSNGLGTGFLYSGKFILTNNHVMPNRDTAAQSKLEFNFEESLDGTIAQIASYDLLPDTLVTDRSLDLTIVQINENACAIKLNAWSSAPVDIAVMPHLFEHVTIIQHPQGGPKQIAITANQIINIFGSKIHYTTDTMPGSSGSPVFNDHWKVIALHRAGGNLTKNEQGDRIFANEGVLLRDAAIHPAFQAIFK